MSAPPPSIKVCPQCGTSAAIDAGFCARCGHQFRTRFDAPAPPFQPPPGSPFQVPPGQGYQQPPGYGPQQQPPNQWNQTQAFHQQPYNPYPVGHPLGPADSNKLLITLLLWFFVGHFGVHRFYMGHHSTGAAMLILSIVGYATVCIYIGIAFLAAVAIWWILDVIWIVTGQLRPMDGTKLI